MDNTELKLIFIPDLTHSLSRHVVCKQFHMINSAKMILDTSSEIRDLVYVIYRLFLKWNVNDPHSDQIQLKNAGKYTGGGYLSHKQI